MRNVTIAALLATGCAGAFQSHLADGWTIDQKATCTTEKGLVLLDVLASIVTGSLGVVGFAKANQDPRITGEQPGAGWTYLGIGGVAVGLAFAASAEVGNSWGDECARALEQQKWHPEFPGQKRPIAHGSSTNPQTNDPTSADHMWCSGEDGSCWVKRTKCGLQCDETSVVTCATYAKEGEAGLRYLCARDKRTCQTLVADPKIQKGKAAFGSCLEQRTLGAPPLPAVPVVAPAPRGFFCAASPTTSASVCAREHVDCDRARSAVIGAVPDVGACGMQESAWCLGPDRCASSVAGCEPQRSASAATEPCVESK